MLAATKYKAQITDWGLSQSKASGTPQIHFIVELMEILDRTTGTFQTITDGLHQRTVYRYLTEDAFDMTMKALEYLGFTNVDDLGVLQRNHPQAIDLFGKQVDVYCKHETYKNQLQEKWEFDIGGGGFKPKEMEDAELKKTLSRDRTKVSVSSFSALGLVEMTRKRTRESLAHILCEPCPACAGKGQVKTSRTICYEILRELLREAKQFNPREFRILASQEVVDMFLEEESQHLAMLGDFIGKQIKLQVETTYHQEQYDVILM